jgi:hypothetical protein
MQRVRRYDFQTLRSPRRTSQGFLRVDGFLTRAGVFEYRRADGSTVRELRPPDEVFKADSMATLRGAPVTDLHPSEMVKPSNARTYSIGFVGEDVRREGNRVAGSKTIMDGAAIALVENGDRRELSCGYDCARDDTPGRWNGDDYGPHVTDGEPYDAVQRDIVYNHVAIGPSGWARGGRDLAMRMDGASHQVNRDDRAAVEVHDDDGDDLDDDEREDSDEAPAWMQPLAISNERPAGRRGTRRGDSDTRPAWQQPLAINNEGSDVEHYDTKGPCRPQPLTHGRDDDAEDGPSGRIAFDELDSEDEDDDSDDTERDDGPDDREDDDLDDDREDSGSITELWRRPLAITRRG